MARVQEGAGKKCERMRTMRTADAARDSGARATLCGGLTSMAEEALLVRQARMRCLGEEEVGRRIQSRSPTSIWTGTHRDKENTTFNYRLRHQSYNVRYVERGEERRGVLGRGWQRAKI